MQLVEILLKGGADPRLKDTGGQSSLYLASWQGHGEAVQALIRGGAAIDSRERFGWTPLMIAAADGTLFVLLGA